MKEKLIIIVHEKIIVFLTGLAVYGCSAVECLREKLREAEKYDEAIEAAGTIEAKETILRNKRLRLAEFDC